MLKASPSVFRAEEKLAPAIYFRARNASSPLPHSAPRAHTRGGHCVGFAFERDLLPDDPYKNIHDPYSERRPIFAEDARACRKEESFYSQAELVDMAGAPFREVTRGYHRSSSIYI